MAYTENTTLTITVPVTYEVEEYRKEAFMNLLREHFKLGPDDVLEMVLDVFEGDEDEDPEAYFCFLKVKRRVDPGNRMEELNQ